MSVQNANQTKTNQQNKSKRTKNNKGNNFLGIKNSDSGEIGYFALWYFLYAQNLFVKKIDWLEVVLIASFTILLKRVKNLVAFEQVIVPTLNKSKNCSSDFEQVKNFTWTSQKLTIFSGFKKLTSYFAGFEQVKSSFRRNSVTYGTPCHAIGHFIFWCHHVTYRAPCHASGHLVIYRQCYGSERAFFTLRRFLPYTPSCWF